MFMHLVRFPTYSESFSDLRDHYHFTRVCGLLDRILSDLVFIRARSADLRGPGWVAVTGQYRELPFRCGIVL